MAAHITLGRQGEEIAREHLLDEGYSILHRNWRYKKAEVDLIAMDGDTLVFIEVKTRSYVYLGEPEDSVNFRKQDLLISAASAYMHLHEHEWAYRFDVISLVKESDQRYHIKHLIDAFVPRVFEDC
jgi:putative endonuclease